jgi:hypothetical protein
MPTTYESEADRIIARMQGGNILAVSPQRTRAIIAEELRLAVEGMRERAAKAAQDFEPDRESDPGGSMRIASDPCASIAAAIRALE